jgi:hypothetical protein
MELRPTVAAAFSDTFIPLPSYRAGLPKTSACRTGMDQNAICNPRNDAMLTLNDH